MDNHEAIEQTMESYEAANHALLSVWDKVDQRTLDRILEKQQHRLEQIADRMYHEEKEDNEFEVVHDTLERYHLANMHLYEHWDSLPSDERLALMRRQWNRLEELRKRIQH